MSDLSFVGGLVVEDLCKDYPSRAAPLHVLRSVNLRVARGESIAIMGPSGCGKSTLLSIIGTLETPTSGRVTLDGVDPFTLSARQLADFRNRHIGFVFQDHHLLPQCNVLENVLIPTVPYCGSAAARDRALELLEQVGLADRLDHLPGELSGGQRQRAAIARALIQQPTLVLADEPTGNLDKTTAESVTELLLSLPAARNVALIVVTHAQRLAARLGKCLELDDGRLAAAT